MDHYILRHITTFQNGVNSDVKPVIPLFVRYAAIRNIYVHNIKNGLCIIKYLYINVLVSRLFHNRCKIGNSDGILKRTVHNGDLKLLEWLHENTNIITRTTQTRLIDNASLKRHLHVAKWLHDNTDQTYENAMNYAANNGDFNMVQWLHENRNETYNIRDAINIANDCEYYHISAWIVRRNIKHALEHEIVKFI